MFRVCNGKDPNLRRYLDDGINDKPCDCGSNFDDVYYMVIYPHQQVHGTKTLKPQDLGSQEHTKIINERLYG